MQISESLLEDIRSRFAHIDECPFQGPRIFFENAGGALTLKSVVETSAKFAAIPDNQGRDNQASRELVRIIAKARDDMSDFFNAPADGFFVGESGTELLFRLIRTAIAAAPGMPVIGSTVEHPATRSASAHWSEMFGSDHVLVPHDNERGTVTAAQYSAQITPDTRVATILHTSPVTGMSNDVQAIASAIREASPECITIVDGIQHACHGMVDIEALGIDGYVVSPYKMFSRHGYGIAWVSDRLKKITHEKLLAAPGESWELGTRDTGAYATFSDVIDYFVWLGSRFRSEGTRRDQILAAGHAIHRHEKMLTDAMLKGSGNRTGLAEFPGISIIGGADNPAREGLVTFYHRDIPAAVIVRHLNVSGIRTHIRKADHYSGNILTPLGKDAAVRVSLCHYNSMEEITALLDAMRALLHAH